MRLASFLQLCVLQLCTAAVCVLPVSWLVSCMCCRDSYLGMLFPDSAVYLNTARECYEAFVIYSCKQLVATL